MSKSTISLYNADCYEKIKEIPDNSVDLVIMDPPYLIPGGKQASGGCFGKEKRAYHNELYTNDLDVGLDMAIMPELMRVMRKTNIYIWCNKNQLRQYINYFEANKCATELLTWHKTNPVPTCNNKYLSDTEYLLYFREHGVPIFGSYDTKRKWYVTPTNTADKKLYHHPTIKPLNIIKNLITNSSLRGGVILDCFMGSGTTGVAAKELGRSFIGIEIDKEYYEIAKKRIEDA